MPRPCPVPWPNASPRPCLASVVARRRVDLEARSPGATAAMAAVVRLEDRSVDLAGARRRPARPIRSGSSRRSMSRRRRRSPAPRGRLRSIFARRAARAAARRSVRWRRSSRTPCARTRPADAPVDRQREVALGSPRRTDRRRRSAATRDSRRAASRSVVDLVGVLAHARALDDPARSRRAPCAGDRLAASVAFSQSKPGDRQMRGLEADARRRAATRAASPASRRTIRRPSPARAPGTRSACRASPSIAVR